MSVKWERIKFPWPWMKDLQVDGKNVYKHRKAIFNELYKSLDLNQMAYDCYGIRSFEKFLNGSQYYNTGRGWESVPNSDHAIFLRKKGTRHIIYVNQPYGLNLERLETWCNTRNLIYVVLDKSWSFYYPNETEIVLIMSNDTYVHYVENIPGFPLKYQLERE